MSPVIKLLETAILEKLRNHCEKSLSKQQGGFMRNMETKSNILKIMNNYHLKFKNSDEKHWYWLFLDWVSAFDKLNREILYLDLTCFNPKELEMLKTIHKNSRTKIGKEIFGSSKGVPQGSILSPFLFDLYADKLLVFLKEKGFNEMGSTSNKEDKKEIESAIYADDDLFVTKNEETLISIIETIYEWAEKYDMILNKKKSAIIRLTKRNDRRTKPLDKTEYFGIPVVNEYKYLGVILTNKAKLSTMIKKIKIKSLFVIGKLYNICKKGSVKFRLNMFKVIIDPLFSYIGVFKQYLNKYELKEVEQT